VGRPRAPPRPPPGPARPRRSSRRAPRRRRPRPRGPPRPACRPRSRTPRPDRRDERDDAFAGREVDGERLEVPVVDADHARVGRERGVELALVADLDERLEAEVARRAFHRPQVGRRERACDEERRRRAERPGLDELQRVDVEVLLEDRHAPAGRAIASVTSAACPPNLEGSVRIDSAAAPPAA
jgi:hypothetical protein